LPQEKTGCGNNATNFITLFAEFEEDLLKVCHMSGHDLGLDLIQGRNLLLGFVDLVNEPTFLSGV
jgi:hypothetical protein